MRTNLSLRLPPKTTAEHPDGQVSTESRLRCDRRRERFVTYDRDVELVRTELGDRGFIAPAR